MFGLCLKQKPRLLGVLEGLKPLSSSITQVTKPQDTGQIYHRMRILYIAGVRQDRVPQPALKLL